MSNRAHPTEHQTAQLVEHLQRDISALVELTRLIQDNPPATLHGTLEAVQADLRRLSRLVTPA